MFAAAVRLIGSDAVPGGVAGAGAAGAALAAAGLEAGGGLCVAQAESPTRPAASTAVFMVRFLIDPPVAFRKAAHADNVHVRVRPPEAQSNPRASIAATASH
ncbi:hypothetical protein SVA_3593 [Sulfurifustis variabilis]|uniref:Uncharacterized protein n=1 Tax=Sulfurifustis variabilis TaxID=1675686 RepID=A0A1B4V9A7_9GAMM|nr:hypothetical protein [Sulfurifustis variabilis]BAU50129.1 hypothetical protein SVA_3593 [Sulfurifustis variabilis]